jgi:hypothetical protein
MCAGCCSECGLKSRLSNRVATQIDPIKDFVVPAEIGAGLEQLTRLVMPIGIIRYMSLEQVWGEELGAHGFVSFGVVLYEMESRIPELRAQDCAAPEPEEEPTRT